MILRTDTDITPRGDQSSYSFDSNFVFSSTKIKRNTKMEQTNNQLSDVIKEFQGVKLQIVDNVGWRSLSKLILNSESPRIKVPHRKTTLPTVNVCSNFKIFCKTPKNAKIRKSKSTSHKLKFPVEINNKNFFRRKYVIPQPQEDFNKMIRRKSCFGAFFGELPSKEHISYSEDFIVNKIEKRKYSKISQLTFIEIPKLDKKLSLSQRNPRKSSEFENNQALQLNKLVSNVSTTISGTNNYHLNLQQIPERVERSKQLRNMKKLQYFVSSVEKPSEDNSSLHIGLMPQQMTSVHRKSLQVLLQASYRNNENKDQQSNVNSQPESSQKVTLRNLFSSSKVTISPKPQINLSTIESPLKKFINQMSTSLNILQKRQPFRTLKSFPNLGSPKQIQLPSVKYQGLSQRMRKHGQIKQTLSTNIDDSFRIQNFEKTFSPIAFKKQSDKMLSSCFSNENKRLRNLIKKII